MQTNTDHLRNIGQNQGSLWPRTWIGAVPVDGGAAAQQVQHHWIVVASVAFDACTTIHSAWPAVPLAVVNHCSSEKPIALGRWQNRMGPFL